MSEQVANKKDEQSLETKCPACGASISFNPKAGKWKCAKRKQFLCNKKK